MRKSSEREVVLNARAISELDARYAIISPVTLSDKVVVSASRRRSSIFSPSGFSGHEEQSTVRASNKKRDDAAGCVRVAFIRNVKATLAP